MVHRIVWRVGAPRTRSTSGPQRLADEGVEPERAGDRLRFADPEGLEHELQVVDTSGDAPLIADHPEVPAEHALQGFDAVRAYAADPAAQRRPARGELGFDARRTRAGRLRGESRGGLYFYDAPPEAPGVPGAGTVHHVAWASQIDEHEEWRDARDRGRRPPDRGDRPLLVPLDLLPRAERRAVRDRHARARASRPTSRSSTSARSWCCRRGSSRCASRSRRRSRRSTNPRAAAASDRPRPLAHRVRPAAGRRRRARWCSSTAAAPTRTTSSRCSTCSTRSGGCVGGDGRAGRSACRPAGRHWYAVRRSAIPTRRPSTPPTRR